MSEPLLEVSNLDIHYSTRQSTIHAVTDASFEIAEEEYHGLVGESGSGKSTIAKSIVGALDSNGEVVDGTIKYRGKEIQNYSEKQLNEEIRWKEISVIPQQAMNSLDPVMRISDQAVELAKTHTDWSKQETLEELRELFDTVGLPPSRINNYPHQFSGGMQQRVVIALALLLKPSLIIADEPTTALDVIMQDQIMDYINRLKTEFGVSMLFITHDIAVINENCDRISVLHGGQVAETGSVTDVYDWPHHPYTILLRHAFPDLRSPDKQLGVIEGSPPKLHQEVNQCTFADRCPWSVDGCYKEAPPLEPVADGDNHVASCIRSDEIPDLAEDFLEESGNDNATEFARTEVQE